MHSLKTGTAMRLHLANNSNSAALAQRDKAYNLAILASQQSTNNTSNQSTKQSTNNSTKHTIDYTQPVPRSGPPRFLCFALWSACLLLDSTLLLLQHLPP
jgi:hypothetical protein